MVGGEAWLALVWEQLVSVREVRLTWNDDVNEDPINLHHHRMTDADRVVGRTNGTACATRNKA
ncbi:hypothetical protein [Cohnella sp. GCM10012308]|uniref:hypothetical protein n=1 Tax=Cohnella sp. GCM10012308 TaxID=3317329 RepID=UPI0036069467